MSQSTEIVAFLFAAFILWLAANNRLTTYAAVFWGDTAKKKPSGDIKPVAPAPGGSGSDILDTTAVDVPPIPGLSGAGGVGGFLEELGPLLLAAG